MIAATLVVFGLALLVAAGIWGTGCLLVSIIRFWWLWLLLIILLGVLGNH